MNNLSLYAPCWFIVLKFSPLRFAQFSVRLKKRFQTQLENDFSIK